MAVFAHIGGFVAGCLLVRVIGRRRTWRGRRVWGGVAPLARSSSRSFGLEPMRVS